MEFVFGETQSALSQSIMENVNLNPAYAQVMEWVSRGNLEKLEQNTFIPGVKEQLLYLLLKKRAN